MESITSVVGRAGYIALFIALVPFKSIEASEEKQPVTIQSDTGRYQIVAIEPGGKRPIQSWVVDTQTGKVKLCSKIVPAKPVCTPWSE